MSSGRLNQPQLDALYACSIRRPMHGTDSEPRTKGARINCLHALFNRGLIDNSRIVTERGWSYMRGTWPDAVPGWDGTGQ